MKKFLIIALLATLAASPALADQNTRAARKATQEQAQEQRHDARLAGEKSHISSVLNRRISVTQHKLSCLQAAQTCVNGASDMHALNSCHTGCGE